MANKYVGSNAQNLASDNKVMFTTGDSNYLMGNVDLSGADTWTVAAHCMQLGDDTMWNDIQFGIKPAWRLLIGFIDGYEALGKGDEFIRSRGKELQDSQSKLYIGSKGAVHGSNYGLQPAKGVEIILKRSMGEVLLSQYDFAKLQNIYMHCYQGVKLWHEATNRQINQSGYIRGAGGHKRVFFARRTDAETLRVALAEEPQQNTAHATKTAMRNLFYQEYNRDSNGNMKIKQLNSVHDSIVYWFHRKFKLELADILEAAFDNEMIIAGRKVKIAYEWDTGECWPKG
ncbi:DNA polymerase [bacterium]|nr:DNA polymerase [bacterium]